MRVDKARIFANVPEHYRAARFGNVAAVPEDALPKYLETCESLRWLLDHPAILAMTGTWGPGKTHMSFMLINEFVAQGRTARYVKAIDYIEEVRTAYNGVARRPPGKIIDQFAQPRLLVVDELHERKNTPDENLHLRRLIDKRYQLNRPTLLVSNERPDGLAESMGESVASRINESGGFIECKWADLRGRLLPQKA